MGKFTVNVKKEYEFDGDKVVVTMKRLSRFNANVINPHIARISERADKARRSEGEDYDKSKLLTAEEMNEYMEATATVLKDSIVDIKGLYIESNEVAVNSDLFNAVLEQVYFTELLVRIVNDLVAESHLTGEEEKKSEEPQ